MKVISFKEFRNVPMRVRIMWIAALLIAATGMVLILVDVYTDRGILTAGMACVVASQIINLFGICRYKDRLYKEI
jgi:hypothetical protein